MSDKTLINGKYYPLWQQLIDKKDFFIDGILEDYGDDADRAMGLVGAENPAITTITDITLEPNGKESAMFTVHGNDFSCSFDVQHGGISGNGEIGWLTFSGALGYRFRIINKRKGGE